MTDLGDKLKALRQKAIDEGMVPGEMQMTNEQVCEGELKLISEHGQPHGIRDRGGYIVFFPPVRKYEGQEERYRNELAQSFRLADFLLRSLESSREPGAPLAGGMLVEHCRLEQPQEKFLGAARNAEEMNIYQDGYDHGFRDGESTAQNREGSQK